ncbi:MAG: sugar fermentation stimulation protein SfsA [Caldithrix sp. RBG_13_44_9]|nr:MAG: sugar fermentation stimulation protein SfsA [Caldithrix sp. RBG_13_44_9]
MKFASPLLRAILLQRYKRFLADVRLEDGRIVTAHCPNSGSIKTCNIPGNSVMVSFHDQPQRKFKYTWEMIQVNGNWVGINTSHPNKLVAEAIQSEKIPELLDYFDIQGEVRINKSSRLDLLLTGSPGRCYIEVKNVTLLEEKMARFPDSVTVRGQKHLQELIRSVKKGDRAVIFFVVQRQDAELFSPADDIDPDYGRLLRKAVKSGVEILVYQAVVNPHQIVLSHRLPVNL